MTTNGRGPDQPPRQRSPLRIRVGIAALAVLGILGLVVAALVGSGSDDADSAVTASPAVDRVIPSPGDEVLQQQRVGVVLDARYRLSSLVVYESDQVTGGVDVTAEVNHIEGLNRFEFGAGRGPADRGAVTRHQLRGGDFRADRPPGGSRHCPLVLRGVLAVGVDEALLLVQRRANSTIKVDVAGYGFVRRVEVDLRLRWVVEGAVAPSDLDMPLHAVTLPAL